MTDRQAARVQQLVMAIMTVAALGAVSYIAIAYRNETATGALLGILSAATSYLFRGRVEGSKP